MPTINRRQFLVRSAAAGSAVAGAGLFQALVARQGLAASGRGRAGDGAAGFGPPAPARAENTGETLLALPRGFRYTAFGRTGELMADGRPTPPLHDGMAAFEGPDHTIRLVRNHEVRGNRPNQFPRIGADHLAYDRTAGGGTTSLTVDPATRHPLAPAFVSVGGTHTNCAGGLTPWGSWVTCEETTIGTNAGYAEPHGYAYEVPAACEAQVPAVPIKAMGRFSHEALSVDPDGEIVYETEDNGSDSGLYRYLPEEKEELLEGGRLQMLAVRGRPNYDTRTGQRVGRPLPVTWVDIEDPDPADAETNESAVFQQGFAAGGARFNRLEGIWTGEKSVFFHSTQGGDAGVGQVWELIPEGRSGGILKLVFESPGRSVLDLPDNLCVSPRGGLVICEDGPVENFLRGLSRKGEIFDLAKNVIPGFEAQEFAGACFDPRGKEILFVNVQTPGITFAIWGPWEEGGL